MTIFPDFFRRRTRRGAVALALAASLTAAALVALSDPSTAATTPPSTPTTAAPHCLSRVTGREKSGELRLSTPSCYATFADMLRNAGIPVTNKEITPSQALDQGLIGVKSRVNGAVALDSGWIIGAHFDGHGYTGSSLSVWGSDCSGGYINLTGYWANRVSSTANGCPVVTHYYWPNLVGTSEATSGGGGDLSTLDNASESIAYGT